jgi:hypothetical protein
MKEYKQQIVELLKSWETGDSRPLAYNNPKKYIQHNHGLGDGLAAYVAGFQSVPTGSVKVNIIRIFQRARAFPFYFPRNSVMNKHALGSRRSLFTNEKQSGSF